MSTAGLRANTTTNRCAAAGYRTYEVYQRERVAESSNLLAPRELIGDEMLTAPYRLLTILREHHPCYRDWVGNRFWITRYDDVTSVFTDDANYETRSKRWFAGHGRSSVEIWVPSSRCVWARANRIDAHVERIVERMLGRPRPGTRSRNCVRRAAAARAVGCRARICPMTIYRSSRRGTGGCSAAQAGILVRSETGARRRSNSSRLLRAAARRAERRPRRRSHQCGGRRSRSTVVPISGADIVATIWEADHETLHGGLANMWFQLLTNPEQLETVRHDRRLVKFAWLETLRHSPPVHSASRFARHEVERFGRLLPDGALLSVRPRRRTAIPGCSTTRNRSSSIAGTCVNASHAVSTAPMASPSGIAFGLGRPSVHPAMPKDRPRSSVRARPRRGGATRRRCCSTPTPTSGSLPARRTGDALAPTRRDVHLLAPPRHLSRKMRGCAPVHNPAHFGVFGGWEDAGVAGVQADVVAGAALGAFGEQVDEDLRDLLRLASTWRGSRGRDRIRASHAASPCRWRPCRCCSRGCGGGRVTSPSRR